MKQMFSQIKDPEEKKLMDDTMRIQQEMKDTDAKLKAGEGNASELHRKNINLQMQAMDNMNRVRKFKHQ